MLPNDYAHCRGQITGNAERDPQCRTCKRFDEPLRSKAVHWQMTPIFGFGKPCPKRLPTNADELVPVER